MGRLSAVAVLPASLLLSFAVVLSGCPEERPAPEAGSGRRSDMVVADPASADGGHAATKLDAPADAGHAAAAPTKRTGPLCSPPAPRRGTNARVGTITVPAPAGRMMQAEGATPAPAIDPAGTRWTWLNLWAAWCVPCREEMPLLREWISRLRQENVDVALALLSLDDDERQLQQFLERATGALPRASEWLPGGSARSRWLADSGLRDDPALPVQLLVRPGGTLACTIQGAVEPGDYDAIKRVLTSAPE